MTNTCTQAELDAANKQRLHNLRVINRAKLRIIQLEAELKEQALQYLSETGQLGERIGELTEVLEEVDAWVESLGYYADEGAELVPVFKKVKAVLKKGYY